MLRKRASRQGYLLRKARVRTINLDDHGEYKLIDVGRNRVVLGGRFDAMLDDVESFLS